MKTIYIVRYWVADGPDWFAITIFATSSKRIAKRYCKRFNDRLRHWKDVYSQYTRHGGSFDGPDELFDRWNRLRETSEATYYELKVR